MNRYEILIGKEPPPEPPKPPEPVRIREVLIGNRGEGKTSELVNCIRDSVDNDLKVVVCVFHPSRYIERMLGPYRRQIYLMSREEYWRGKQFTDMRIDAFYYDDINLHETLPEISNAQCFYDIPEISVTCDTPDIGKFLGISPSNISNINKLHIGRTDWDVISVPRVSRVSRVSRMHAQFSDREFPLWGRFKQEYQGNWINEPVSNTSRQRASFNF